VETAADGDVSDVLVGVDLEEQAGAANRLQDGEVAPALLVAYKQVVLPANGNDPKSSLGRVVVERQLRILKEFAQGLSLDVLVRHANQHLERLSERYQLARVEGEELGLEIIDRYQASVTRPMASLSGGESFLASLALALGLSDLAGRNVQIDSLFIDEGFGSLDGDTLDEAISALEGLRLREKTVGVISHVELLKERISTQVVVGRDAAGRGRIDVVG
jgi:exonuclease SbcC